MLFPIEKMQERIREFNGIEMSEEEFKAALKEQLTDMIVFK